LEGGIELSQGRQQNELTFTKLSTDINSEVLLQRVRILESQDSILYIATSGRLDGPVFEYWQGQWVFCPPELSRPGLEST
jgi:hypothetical protein